jgi:alanine or glycine:cation symporter, AGCS family
MEIGQMLTHLSDIVWGPVMIIMLVGTGLFLTVRLKFLQFRYLGHGFKCISGKYDKPDEEGDISHFKALAAALSATIGTGNIAGVATAISLGGPGAVFWMWVTALVGMATKFTSCSLALHYREMDRTGASSGGPMYYLEKGFRPHWLAGFSGEQRTKRWATTLGTSFAVFAMIASFGIGNMVQANSVVDGLKYICPASWQSTGFTIQLSFLDWQFHVGYLGLAVGILLAFLVAIVILGGIKRIANVASRLVPSMCVIYVLGALIILLLHLDRIPEAFRLIMKHAFMPMAAGGGVAGFTVSQALRFGVARGIFSNESGLGSAPMAHAAAKTKETAREGFVAMLGPFIDTIIICTMTALVILVTGACDSGLTSSSLTARAFDLGLFGYGHYIVSLGLILFAYSTMISWSYYGDRCVQFLFGVNAVKPYRLVYVALVIVGSVGGLRVIWSLADVLNALMALPNLIGLIALSGITATYTSNYVSRLKRGDFE